MRSAPMSSHSQKVFRPSMPRMAERCDGSSGEPFEAESVELVIELILSVYALSGARAALAKSLLLGQEEVAKREML